MRPLQPRLRGLPGNTSNPVTGLAAAYDAKLANFQEKTKEDSMEEGDLLFASAVSAVRLRDLAELRSFRHPPAVVCQVLEAVAVLLGVTDTRWSQMRRMLDANLVGRLASFDLSRVGWAQAERLKVLLQVPTFTDGGLWDRCPAVAPLAAWCAVVGQFLEENPPRPPPAPPVPGSGQSSCRGVRSEFSPPAAQLKSNTPLAPAAYADHALASGAVLDPPMMAPRGVRREEPPRVRPELSGLIVEPDLWSLPEAELARVCEFRVSREGVGSVTFHGATDCRELLWALPEVVVLNPGEVIVYPDQDVKPPVGQGLNKPATVMLYGCLPKSSGFRDKKARERYKKRVRQMTEDKGAEFVDYDGDQGVWHFRVHHF